MEGQNVKNVINNTDKNNNNGKQLVIENNTEKPQKQVNDNNVLNKWSCAIGTKGSKKQAKVTV